MKKRNTWPESFDCAYEGIVHTVATERNMRIHVCIAALVTLFALVFRISLYEFLLLLFPMSLVLAAELMNTAVEKTVDLVTEEIHPLAKIAKEAAAGAVLVCAGFAVIIGGAVFYEPVMNWLFYGIRPSALSISSSAILSNYTIIALTIVLTFLIGISLNALCMSNHSNLRFNPAASLVIAAAMVLTLSLNDYRIIIMAFFIAIIILICIASLKNVRPTSLISGAILGGFLAVLVVLGLGWI